MPFARHVCTRNVLSPSIVSAESICGPSSGPSQAVSCPDVPRPTRDEKNWDSGSPDLNAKPETEQILLSRAQTRKTDAGEFLAELRALCFPSGWARLDYAPGNRKWNRH